jgi:spore maturation protein CgeB
VFYEYNNLSQLQELIDYYLEHEDEREKIRISGHEFVKNNYTYKNRWESVLKELNI